MQGYEMSDGTTVNPLNMKCTSMGRPSRTSAYLSIVTQDGRQFCFDISFNAARLIAAQSADIVASWPVEPEESRA